MPQPHFKRSKNQNSRRIYSRNEKTWIRQPSEISRIERQSIKRKEMKVNEEVE